MAAHPFAVDFYDAGELSRRLHRADSLTKLVGENERRLVRAAEFTAEMQRGVPVCAIYENGDGHEDVLKRHLATAEERAGGKAELLAASLALECLPGGDFVDAQTPTRRAERRPAVLRKADRLKARSSLWFRHSCHFCQTQGLRCGGKEEVLRHSAVRSKRRLTIYTKNSVLDILYFYEYRSVNFVPIPPLTNHVFRLMRMDLNRAAQGFSALSTDVRLSILKLLARAGEDGMASGEIAKKLKVPANSLSQQLQVLEVAGLVTHDREGRNVFYAVDLDEIRWLMTALAMLVGA